MLMTRRLRVIALAVVATAAISGLSASVAMATETLSFVSQFGIFPLKTTLKGGEVTFHEEGTSYGCSASTGEGQITGHKTGTVKLKLTGCRTMPSFQPCQNTATSGEIVSLSLPVQLVYKSKASHEAALDLNYEEPTEEFPPPPKKQLATWHCGSLNEFGPFGIRGSILAPVTPVNTLTLAHTVKMLEHEGLQSPSSYETEAGKVFSAFPELAIFTTTYFKGAVTGELEMKTIEAEGKIEIKA
jgi:hypothetical protein